MSAGMLASSVRDMYCSAPGSERRGRLVLVSIGAFMNHPREWFQPKIVGIGWTPRTWEGWAIIVSVIAVGALVGRVNF